MIKKLKKVPVPQQILNDLSTARDRFRVRAHLLSMDARTRWNELEPKLLEARDHLEREGDHAAEFLITAAQELNRAVETLMEGGGADALGLRDSVQVVMTKAIVSCSPGDSLDRAAQLMWEHDCGALPVVAETGVVLGMVTDRDICMAAYTRGGTLHSEAVASAMSKELYSCKLSDPTADVLAAMARHQVRRLPVVSESGTLLGLVSLADIARRAHANADACRAITQAIAAISERPLPIRIAAE